MNLTYKLKIQLESDEHLEDFEAALSRLLERHCKIIPLQEYKWERINQTPNEPI